MIDSVGLAFVVGGLVLLFFGAALSNYGVGLLGMIVGGGSGYLVAPTVGGVLGFVGPQATVVAVLVGVIIGVIATYALFSLTIAAINFVLGTYFGLTVFAPLFVAGAWYFEWIVAIGIGGAAAFFGLIMTKTTMIVITSFVGAALASRSLTFGNFEAAQLALSTEPLLFDVTSPLFLVLLVLGALTQFGLFKFGYVSRTVTLLPGVRVLRNRGERAE